MVNGSDFSVASSVVPTAARSACTLLVTCRLTGKRGTRKLPSHQCLLSTWMLLSRYFYCRTFDIYTLEIIVCFYTTTIE